MITPLPLSYYNQPWIIENQKGQMALQYSLSDQRWDPKFLETGVILSDTTLVAVFIDDVFNAFISSVDFYLDAAPVHTELTAPWDYDGTAGGGEANLVTFTSGLHVITADIHFTGGFVTPNPFQVSAQFQVL